MAKITNEEAKKILEEHNITPEEVAEVFRENGLYVFDEKSLMRYKTEIGEMLLLILIEHKLTTLKPTDVIKFKELMAQY
jgi:hypothetical protein